MLKFSRFVKKICTICTSLLRCNFFQRMFKLAKVFLYFQKITKKGNGLEESKDEVISFQFLIIFIFLRYSRKGRPENSLAKFFFRKLCFSHKKIFVKVLKPQNGMYYTHKSKNIHLIKDNESAYYSSDLGDKMFRF